MSLRSTLMAAFLGGLVLIQSAEARPRFEDEGRDPDRRGRSSERSPDGFVDRRPQMSPADAAREAQRRYGGGKVLSVDAAGGGYRVKLVRDGDVRIVFIPAR